MNYIKPTIAVLNIRNIVPLCSSPSVSATGAASDIQFGGEATTEMDVDVKSDMFSDNPFE